MVLFLPLVHPVEIHSARADSAVSNVFPRLLRVFLYDAVRWQIKRSDILFLRFILLNKGRVIFSQNLSQKLSIQGISIVNYTNVCYTSVSRIEHIMFTNVIIKYHHTFLWNVLPNTCTKNVDLRIVLGLLPLLQAPKMSSTKSKKKHRARTQRYTSNVFAMFNQAQIQEFKVINKSVFNRLINTVSYASMMLQ